MTNEQLYRMILEQRYQIERLQAELQHRPVILPEAAAGAEARSWITIGSTGNQALLGGQTGIRYQTSEITEVSTAYDPSTSPTTTSDLGIGWGDLWVADVVGSTKVLVAMDPRAPYRFDALGGASYSVYATVSIPVTGGGSVTCYLLAQP